MSPPPPLSTGRSVRVRLAAIGSSSAKMSSISSRRARREVGSRRTEAESPRSRSRREAVSKASSVPVSGLEVFFVFGTVVVVLGEAEVDERFMPGIP